MADDSQVTCHICNKPIDLEADLYTDGDGKAVHEDCYVRQITREATFLNRALARALPDFAPGFAQCERCRTELTVLPCGPA